MFWKNVLCYLTVHWHNYDKKCTILSHTYRNSLMVVNYECICGFIYKSVEKHRLTLALFIKSMQKASRIVHLKWPVCWIFSAYANLPLPVCSVVIEISCFMKRSLLLCVNKKVSGLICVCLVYIRRMGSFPISLLI